jgi:translation initiation factor 1
MIFPLDELQSFTKQVYNLPTVHIRKQQRASKKYITTIEGLSRDLNLKRMCKMFKVKLATSSAIKSTEEFGDIICVQGDMGTKVAQLLVEHCICTRDEIVVHGA